MNCGLTSRGHWKVHRPMRKLSQCLRNDLRSLSPTRLERRVRPRKYFSQSASGGGSNDAHRSGERSAQLAGGISSGCSGTTRDISRDAISTPIRPPIRSPGVEAIGGLAQPEAKASRPAANSETKAIFTATSKADPGAMRQRDYDKHPHAWSIQGGSEMATERMARQQ